MGTKGSDIIRIQTESELEALHVETFINTSPLVTKVTDHGVIRGLIRGNVRTGKKALKDIALAVSHLFPDSAFGSSLDEVADDHGIAPRFSAAQSSTYVRIVADNTTVYQSGVHTFSDNKGNIFDLDDDIAIGAKGFGYAKVRSQQSGASTNVAPYTIVNVNTAPVGHIGVINEYAATGGRDVEDDETFKRRIKEGSDILARGTLSYLTQAFARINSNVLRVINEGIDVSGKVKLGILTVNGIDLTDDELQTILDGSSEYLSITEMAPIGTTAYGVLLKNVDYTPIDVSMRVELIDIANLSTFVQETQQKFSKRVDFRFWNSATDRVEWDDLLSIVRNSKYIKSVSDAHFTPSVDLTFAYNAFPRFRGFIVNDLAGNLIVSSTDLDPIFYPQDLDASFNATIL